MRLLKKHGRKSYQDFAKILGLPHISYVDKACNKEISCTHGMHCNVHVRQIEIIDKQLTDMGYAPGSSGRAGTIPFDAYELREEV